MSFVNRIISGRGGPVTFDKMDRAMQLTETVEDSRPMWKWVTENDKEPKYFSGWTDTIKAYHEAIGTRWTKNYAVPSPYGFMGYDIIKPPKVVAKPITFDHVKPISFPELETDSDEDFLFDLLNDGEDEESDGEEEADSSEKNSDEQPLHKSENGSDNDSLLSEVSSLDLSDSEDEELCLEDCDYKCGIPVDTACDTTICLKDIGGNYAHHDCHEKAKAKKLTLLDIPKDTHIRDLPEGVRLEDLPRGAVITLNDSDIEWGSVIGSDSEDEPEEDKNVARLEKAIREDKVAVRPCKCGSTSHRRTNHKSCPLNKKK